MKGKIFIISGPSGVGKGTVIDLAKPYLANFKQISTITTRKKRKNGRSEKDRKFVTKNEFHQLIRDKKLVEHNLYNGNYYGTPKQELEKVLIKGQNILLEIDINGAKRVNKQYPKNSILIFIWSKIQQIEDRLKKRGQNSNRQIKERLKQAKKELATKNQYDFEIENKESRPKEAANKLIKFCNHLKA